MAAGSLSLALTGRLLTLSQVCRGGRAAVQVKVTLRTRVSVSRSLTVVSWRDWERITSGLKISSCLASSFELYDVREGTNAKDTCQLEDQCYTSVSGAVLSSFRTHGVRVYTLNRHSNILGYENRFTLAAFTFLLHTMDRYSRHVAQA